MSTRSNTVVAAAEVVWLLTARPTSTSGPIASAWLPTIVHDTPSVDTAPVTTSAVRCSRTQQGATPAPPDVLTLRPPPTGRRWNASPLPADTSMNAWAALGSVLARIITPAFTQAATFCTDATRAT